MKKFLLGGFLSLLATSPIWALSGGPFDQDSPLATGADGTYQAIARGTEGSNLIGVVAFTFSSTGGSTGAGIFFSEGVQRLIQPQAVVDLPARNIAAVFAIPAISDNGDVSGAFTADITSTAPILLFEGTGEYTGPDQDQTLITEETVTVTGSEDDPDGETTTTVTSSRIEVDTVPFTISGLRTSLQVSGVFFPINTVD